tara:strand:+ start:52223 stop:53599 length:1377 start_codon:yes stop_codon:yes gene_type:complete
MSAESMQDTQTVSALTRYPVGSLREISSISFPLMLSALSGALMMFFDRYILAQYSVESMNAVTGASLSIWIFHVLLLGITGIAEVFVGQYNGAKQFDKIASPVWQMIWFSLFVGMLLLPIAQLIPHFFIPERYHAEGGIYFKWLLSFSTLVGINTALTAFFVGQGKVKLITTIVILGNIINVFGDLLLVFGIKGIFEPLGTLGAALATIASQMIQFAILLSVFLNKNNRALYKTHQAHIKFSELFECIKIGLPSALGHMVEIAAWSIQFHMLSMVSHTHATIIAIGQSIFGLVAFTSEGLSKGVTAIASNLIGAKNVKSIPKVFTSSFVLHLGIACILIAPLLFHPEWLLEDFLSAETNQETIDLVLHYAALSCSWIFLYFIFDGVVWISAGFLTAAKDTVFILVANALNSWIFALIPTYYFVVIKGASPEKAWIMITLYGVVNMICFAWRMKVKLLR